MKEENAISRHPIYKVIKKINNAADLDSWIKTGEYGVTSLEAVNGSYNFNLEIKPTSANGHVMQRQTPSDSVGLVTYVRFLIDVNVWDSWVSYDVQDPTGQTGIQGPGGTNGVNGIDGKSSYQSYLDTTSDNPVMTEAEWLVSLKGNPGDDGYTPQKGVDYFDGENPTGAILSDGSVTNILALTQVEYDAIDPKDPFTLYFIKQI